MRRLTTRASRCACVSCPDDPCWGESARHNFPGKPFARSQNANLTLDSVTTARMVCGAAGVALDNKQTVSSRLANPLSIPAANPAFECASELRLNLLRECELRQAIGILLLGLSHLLS